MSEVAIRTKTIRQRVFIDAEPREVFQAFVDPKKHSDFTGSKATGGTKVGQRFTAWDGYSFGKVVELAKNKRVVQEWKTTEWPEGYPPSVLKLEFKRKEGGTEVLMTHSKVPADQASSYRQGWTDFYWKPLKNYFKK